jgi:sterol desaturase/sphingolipid hydroxylase (fatty acid hydroxylase superfamily)
LVVGKLLTVPGLILLAIAWLSRQTSWQGLLHGIVPTSGVVVALLWLIAFDLVMYVGHVLLHKIPILWRFHRLHHSSTDFNILVGARVALAEAFFLDIIVLVTLLVVLGFPSPQIFLGIRFTREIIGQLKHSDLPLDYGLLGKLIISPRFHRFHHSNHPEDIDKNYAAIFTFWDYLFGTVGRRYREAASVADGCSLGLTDEEGGKLLNRSWLTSAIYETVIDYAVRCYRLRRDAVAANAQPARALEAGAPSADQGIEAG